ncbi:methylated-DNA--[protein]-cysteine S-methyltransferase [Rhodococcus aerolatus]
MAHPTHAVLDSPVGPLTVLLDGEALVGLWMAQHRRRASVDLGVRDDAAAAHVAAQLADYFAGERTVFTLDLAPVGTPFDLRVWELLRAIPHGETRTYGDLARALGDPGAAQAVGTANGRNPISIVVPCHRVVGADGSLTGYAGGVATKRALLDLEQPAAARLF